MAELRTTIVVDYQNVHLVGHGLFVSNGSLAQHETLVDPLLFAQQLLRVRNEHQKPDMPLAVPRRVLVFRGLPSPEHDPDGYRRNQAQKAHWERDKRVTVTYRPLKYEYERAADGHPASDVYGRKIVKSKREKGIDVLCALAAVGGSQDAATDLVILASSDTDLAPGVEHQAERGRVHRKPGPD